MEGKLFAMADCENPRPSSLRKSFSTAARFWERRRIIYNVVLAAFTLMWMVATWPHFRPAFTWGDLLKLFGLAMIANVLYCGAYLVDIPLRWSGSDIVAKRWRSGLWWAGMLFAVLLTNYWIADEIYPYVQ